MINKCTQEQRTRILGIFLYCNELIVTVQRGLMQAFSLRSSPFRKCIINIVKGFWEFEPESDKGLSSTNSKRL